MLLCLEYQRPFCEKAAAGNTEFSGQTLQYFHKKYGQISNWIIGNEVNNYNTYNYAGSQTLRQYSQIYADQFRLAYNTLVSVYSNARVYISLDHLWNTNYVNGTFASRKMLDSFASKYVPVEICNGTLHITHTVLH